MDIVRAVIFIWSKKENMPGSVKLRSIKRFGQENNAYEISDEGEKCHG